MDRKLTPLPSDTLDAETVECPACKGGGRCIQCQGQGRIPFQMAKEIEKRVKEREDTIRNEGRNEAREAIEAGEQTIRMLQEGTTSLKNRVGQLQNDLNRSNKEKERIESDAKEAGRAEGRKEVELHLETQNNRIKQLQGESETLQDRLASQSIEIKDSKKQLDEANKTVRKLTDQLRQNEVGRTPQEYGLLKEEVLVDFLTREFPDDQVIRTPGSHKGDVIQRVNHEGVVVGTILHERKETQSFDKAWMDKLDKDRLEREADFATLITKTMNKDDEPVRLYPSKAVMMPTQEIVKNIVAYLRWQIITGKSNIDDSKRIEMKAYVDKCVDSYQRQWTVTVTTARSLKKALEEMADATKEGMEGISDLARMLKLPSPKPLQELPFKPQLLPS